MAGYRLTVMQFPSNRWGFVGSIPTVLGYEVEATEADVGGCRSHWNADRTKLLAWRFPTFETKEEAINHITQCGIEYKD